MRAIASQITSRLTVFSTVYSDADQRKHQRSASPAFVLRIHRIPVISPHKWPVTRKMFPFDDVIMLSSDHFIWHLDILHETGLSAADSDERLIIMMVVMGFQITASRLYVQQLVQHNQEESKSCITVTLWIHIPYNDLAMRKACPSHDVILISIMPHSHRQNTTLCQMFDKHVWQVSRDVRTMVKMYWRTASIFMVLFYRHCVDTQQHWRVSTH